MRYHSKVWICVLTFCSADAFATLSRENSSDWWHDRSDSNRGFSNYFETFIFLKKLIFDVLQISFINFLNHKMTKNKFQPTHEHKLQIFFITFEFEVAEWNDLLDYLSSCKGSLLSSLQSFCISRTAGLLFSHLKNLVQHFRSDCFTSTISFSQTILLKREARELKKIASKENQD